MSGKRKRTFIPSMLFGLGMVMGCQAASNGTPTAQPKGVEVTVGNDSSASDGEADLMLAPAANDQDGKSNAAVLYFGGFGSCGSTTDSAFQKFDSIDARRDPSKGGLFFPMMRWRSKILGADNDKMPHRFLIACYPLWTNMKGTGFDGIAGIFDLLKIAFGAGEIRKIGTLQPNTFNNYIYTFDNLASNAEGKAIPRYRKQKLGPFFDYVSSTIQSQRIRNVAILGHSYGGYTAMLVANKLLKAPREQSQQKLVSALYTFDPISMNTCTSQVIIAGLSSQPPRGEPGCTGAPTTQMDDQFLNKDMLRYLSNELGSNWANFYQTTDKYLHSSLLDLPISNTSVNFAPDNTDSIVNHVFYVYPDTGTQSGDGTGWLGMANGVAEAVRQKLRDGAAAAMR